jgi:imidazolonepropionase-like amidohydrolase
MTSPAARKALLVTVVASVMSSLIALAQERPIAFTGAMIYTIAGPVIEKGSLVIDGGVIVAVGPSGEVEIPGGAEIRDLSGKVVLPGLVDTHSHLGRVEGGDRSGPLHPGVRALDAVDIRAETFRRALAGGITTVHVMPGSGHLMSGQTVYLKLRAEPRRLEDWLFCADPLTEICGGMKMANGTNSLSGPPFPGTRAKSAAMVRELFHRAADYRSKRERAGADASRIPDRDLGFEAIQEIVDGRRIVHFHTHRHDDVLTALRLAQELGFQPVLHHVSEAWKVAEEIAQAGAPASIIAIDSPGGKLEAIHLSWESGAALERAGADVAFHTDDLITDSRLFLRSAAFGVRGGMSREKALEALTLAGARMMGLAERVGSLEPGKDADFVVLSGDPLSIYTRVEETWVEGVRVFDRSDPVQARWATGGYGVFEGGAAHAHGEVQ